MPNLRPVFENDHPLADTEAALMLAQGLKHLSKNDGISIRELARRMGYKQGTILSHMATGRVAIPIDRVPELARHLGIDQNAFLVAVLTQRHPEIYWPALLREDSVSSVDNGPAAELQMIARLPLRSLTEAQRKVMREVAADPNADQRWLSVHELAAVQLLRSLRPQMGEQGISTTDQRALAATLSTSSHF